MFFCKRRSVLNGVKISVFIIILAVVVFYILPRLVGALWLIEPDEDKMQNNRNQTPMRVEYTVAEKSAIKI